MIYKDDLKTSGDSDKQFSMEELRIMLTGFARDNPGHPFNASLVRAYALKDLFFFADYVLGYNHERPSPTQHILRWTWNILFTARWLTS